MTLLIRGDARALPLADRTVDLVVTSPPYFGLRSYQDGGEHYAAQVGAEPTPAEFVDALIEATAEMVRVLKPSGSIWVNLGDKYCGYTANTGVSHSFQQTGKRETNTGGAKVPPSGPRSAPTVYGVPNKSLMGLPWRYAIRCIDDLGLILRAEVIWSKPNGLPESATDRVRRSHETWFHFTLEPRYYSAVDELREPHLQPDRVRADVFGGATASNGVRHNGATVYTGPTTVGRLPGSVWEIPTQPLTVPDRLGVDHFAAFPMEFPRRIITGWSPRTGTVLDPFGGTGTTALVADVLGRQGISVDLSADYCRLAAWRTTDRGQRAAAAKVDRAAAAEAGKLVDAGQADLFGAL